MGGVYKRNRKSSSLEKYLLIEDIKKELVKMKRSSFQYFRDEERITYDDLLTSINSISKYMTTCNTASVVERKNEEIKIDCVVKSIYLVEHMIKTLQTYYVSQDFVRENSKRSVKMRKRVFRLGEKLIELSKKLRKYLKGLRQKTKA